MERVLAQNALVTNASHAASQWNTKKHTIPTLVGMTQVREATGKKEFTPESTEINKSLIQ